MAKQVTFSDTKCIKQCVQALIDGQCIAYPAEAVWGLGCDPNNEAAVQNILRIKHRSESKGLILVASDISHFSALLYDLPYSTLEKMKASWPGHVTWLVPHKGRILSCISGDSDKVAIRVSSHPFIQALGQAFEAPFVSTSANPAGEPPALLESEARRYFISNPELIFAQGNIGNEQRPSMIIDAETENIIRQ